MPLGNNIGRSGTRISVGVPTRRRGMERGVHACNMRSASQVSELDSNNRRGSEGKEGSGLDRASTVLCYAVQN